MDMKYHDKEKIYCLSEEDRDELFREGKQLFFDSELNNYYWFLETVKETSQDFFEVQEEDWLKIIDLGYTGQNDIRDIMEWLEFEYKISYTRQHYQGTMIYGRNSDLLESHIVLDHEQLSSFVLITVENRDERSKFVLMKKVLGTMLGFFEMKSGKIYGPSTSIFNKMFRGETEWT
jgi:hypothetical protein